MLENTDSFVYALGLVDNPTYNALEQGIVTIEDVVVCPYSAHKWLTRPMVGETFLTPGKTVSPSHVLPDGNIRRVIWLAGVLYAFTVVFEGETNV